MRTYEDITKSLLGKELITQLDVYKIIHILQKTRNYNYRFKQARTT